MSKSREQIREERRQLRAEYGDLFDSVAALLFRHDPIGIAFENPHTDEYEPETRTILPRLRDCESAGDVLPVVHEEFVKWFDSSIAGPPEAYIQIAAEIWELLERNKGRLAKP
jgi:hypothetical protein